MKALVLVVSDKKIFENCILKTYFLTPWPTYATNHNHLNNFGRGPPRDHFCEVWSKSNEWFQRRICLSKSLRTTDNGRGRTTDKGRSQWHWCDVTTHLLLITHGGSVVQDFYLLKCSHTTAYGISVCQRMIIRSHTQTYVRGRLGIRRVRSSYADIRRCTLLYAEAKSFLDMFKKFQRMPAYQ